VGTLNVDVAYEEKRPPLLVALSGLERVVVRKQALTLMILPGPPVRSERGREEGRGGGREERWKRACTGT